MVEWRGLHNHLTAMIDELGLGSDDRIAFTAPLTFDISVWQMLTPLMAGARVCGFDQETVRDDDALEFVGRVDEQVKVRGYRVELAEVDAALARQPGVAQAAAALRTANGTGGRLIGYVTAARGAKLDPATIRAGVAEQLPAFMVPDVVSVFPALPLNTNGKLDQRALPAPGRAGGTRRGG
jgi:acyl-CoA synthetase (AMP-forming)/AMP-acid ligase II